jgi:hypothetical protein
VIEGDDAVHFGAAEIERVGQQRHRRRIDIAELLLQGVQHRQQRAGQQPALGDQALRRLGIPGSVLRHRSPRDGRSVGEGSSRIKSIVWIA